MTLSAVRNAWKCRWTTSSRKSSPHCKVMQSDWVSSERHSRPGSQFVCDDLNHQRCEHPNIRIFLRRRESGADFLGELVIDAPHFNQASEIGVDESGRALDHVITRSEAKDVRPRGANHKTILPKQCR